MVVNGGESVSTSQSNLWILAAYTRNYFLDWELERSVLLVIWATAFIFNHITDFDIQLDAPVVVDKSVPQVFVVSVVKSLWVNQLVDARIKQEALEVS